MKRKDTSIRLSLENLLRLKQQKLCEGESYDAVLSRILVPISYQKLSQKFSIRSGK